MNPLILVLIILAVIFCAIDVRNIKKEDPEIKRGTNTAFVVIAAIIVIMLLTRG